MSNSLPPDQRRRILREDEAIALFVALLTFGGIFGWAVSQSGQRFNVSDWWSGISSTITQQPLVTTPSSGASPSVGQVPSPAPLPQPSPLTGETITGDLGVSGETLSSPQPSPSATVGTAESTATVSPSPTLSPSISPSPSPQATALKPSPSLTNPGTPLAFQDVPQDFWAAKYIGALSAVGVIGGFPDGTFRPNQPVTRAEYAVQLQKAFTKPNQLPPKAFSDVPAGSKWSVAVDGAVKANFMSGYPEGTFLPEQQVLRVEAVASMVKGMGLPLPPDPEAVLQAYSDGNKVPGWARSWVAAAINAGLISGDPDTREITPNKPATRADIAALIYKGLEVNGTLPQQVK